MSKDDKEKIAEFADRFLNLKTVVLSDEYFYQSLPHCVIDAIYSIGVRYTSVQNVVDKYCRYFGLQKFRACRADLPSQSSQQSIGDLIKSIKSLGIEKITDDVFCNRQRTSTTNGILKSDAVWCFAAVLEKHDVNYFQDIPSILNSGGFEKDLKQIKGQSSGVSLKYFFMLAGSEGLVKPDRMIIRFLEGTLKRSVQMAEAEPLLTQASLLLRAKYSHMNPRLLDYAIWNYQRQQ